MSTQVISFIISYPTADAKDTIKDRFHVTGVVSCLEDIADRFLLSIPAHILTMVASAFYQQDQYRVELVEGLTSYKFYRRPDVSLWPKSESGTFLEAWQQGNIEAVELINKMNARRLELIQHKLDAEKSEQDHTVTITTGGLDNATPTGIETHEESIDTPLPSYCKRAKRIGGTDICETGRHCVYEFHCID